MATIALGAAVVGSNVLQNLWYYNRENYMFDVPLRQNTEFQKQNINISRFGLFREDVRDLAALTTEKVESYLIVNTLKLGFIVTLFFNYDRTDTEHEHRNFMEMHVNFIFSVTLCSALFWLFASIWFSMHAIVIAQSFMTKMLLQVVRIPLPNAISLKAVTKDSAQFEANMAAGFRIPWLRQVWSRLRPGREASVEGAGAASGVASQSAWPAPSTSTLSSRNQEKEPLMTPDGMSATPKGMSNSISIRKAAIDRLREKRIRELGVGADRETDSLSSPNGHACSAPSTPPSVAPSSNGLKTAPTLSVSHLIHGIVDLSDQLGEVKTEGREPHTKLFRLLGSNWSAYVLHSSISMVIGTASMLSGMSFYALFYFRGPGPFVVEPGGWVTFCMLAVLARWSLLLELNAHWLQQVLLTAMMLGPQIIFVVVEAIWDIGDAVDNETSLYVVWAPAMAMTLQAMWVIYLCWTSMPWKLRFDAWRPAVEHHWPTMWRASQFLNVLHAETSVAENQAEVGRQSCRISRFLSYGKEGKEARQMDSGATMDSKDDSAQELRARSEKIYHASAHPLLACLDTILELPAEQLAQEHRALIQEVRGYLFAMAHAVGIGTYSLYACSVVDGFFLTVCEKTPCWVDPSGGEPVEGATTVTLDSLLNASAEVANRLREEAYSWKEEDMERLAAYGGEFVHGTSQFQEQFVEQGLGNRPDMRPMGWSATYIFTGGHAVMSILWAVAVIYTIVWSVDPDDPGKFGGGGTRHSSLVEGERISLGMPRSWMAPAPIGCDANGSRLVLADVDGIYIHSLDLLAGLESAQPGNWTRHGACGEGGIVDADFGPPQPGGDVWAATEEGIQLASRHCSPGRPLAKRLAALALDAAPLAATEAALAGLAMVGDRSELHALERVHNGTWRLAGRINVPEDREWAAVSVLHGRAFVVDKRGGLLELRPDSGTWTELLRLDSNLHWRGLCALPGTMEEVDSWIALGHDPEGASPPGFWLIRRPTAHKEL